MQEPDINEEHAHIWLHSMASHMPLGASDYI